MNEHTGDGTGVKMVARLKLIAEGGIMSSGGDSIRIEKANAVTIFLTAATDYSGSDPSVTTARQMAAVINHGYTELMKGTYF